MNTKTFTT